METSLGNVCFVFFSTGGRVGQTRGGVRAWECVTGGRAACIIEMLEISKNLCIRANTVNSDMRSFELKSVPWCWRALCLGAVGFVALSPARCRIPSLNIHQLRTSSKKSKMCVGVPELQRA